MMSYEHQLKSMHLIEQVWPDDTQSCVFPFCVRNSLRTFECQMEGVLKLVKVIASCRFDLLFIGIDNTADTFMCLSCRCLRLYVSHAQSADQLYVMRKSGLSVRSHIST